MSLEQYLASLTSEQLQRLSESANVGIDICMLYAVTISEVVSAALAELAKRE